MAGRARTRPAVERAVFPFDTARSVLPGTTGRGTRQGLSLGDMTKPPARGGTARSWSAAMSERGATEVATSLRWRPILGELERKRGRDGTRRDPERYWFGSSATRRCVAVGLARSAGTTSPSTRRSRTGARRQRAVVPRREPGHRARRPESRSRGRSTGEETWRAAARRRGCRPPAGGRDRRSGRAARHPERERRARRPHEIPGGIRHDAARRRPSRTASNA